MKNVQIQITGEHRSLQIIGTFTRCEKKWSAEIVVGNKKAVRIITDDKPCMATLENLIDVQILKVKGPRIRYGV